MIVTVDNEDAIVMGYNSNNTWFCIKEGSLRLRRFEGKEIFIKNPYIPNDWMISNYHYVGWHNIPDWLDADYNDYVFFCYPRSIEPSYLIELSYDNVNPEERTPFENYVTLKAMNEIREFHGLEKVEIRYVEEYEKLIMSEDERRQQALSDELDEYLRIGEEIEKNKSTECKEK